MDEFGSPLGRFGTTVRLFSLVDQLPKDQQLILLKQLLGERITQHLYKLVLEMTGDQRQRLFEQLIESPPEPTEVTTINLDEDDSPMRQIHRKACHLRAVCVLDAATFDGTITDISTVGMFIKTERSFPAGKPIRISCRLPGLEKALIFSGETIRSEPTGIGIRLNGLRPEQERAIRAFIHNR
ncbi:MAG: PilZ domain-containing protein [Desulfobacterales bacterium]|jgi:hypothetical protein|nr:PilZ domain-containing protein [Desulfobacterales bacterium]